MQYQSVPMSYAEAKARMVDGRLVVVVRLSLDDMIDTGDMGSFNDLVDDQIADNWVVSDIGYKAVGIIEGDVLVEVNCEPQSMMEEEDEEDLFIGTETGVRLIVPYEELMDSDLELGMAIYRNSVPDFPVKKDFVTVEHLIKELHWEHERMIGQITRFHNEGWIEIV